MTLGRPIPATNDAAQQRLELELLLKQPVPDPEQLHERCRCSTP
jgi:type IV pilus assembly protein PilB